MLVPLVHQYYRWYELYSIACVFWHECIILLRLAVDINPAMKKLFN